MHIFIKCSSFRGGMDANQILRSRFSSAVSSTLEDADIASKNLLCSIDRKYLVCASDEPYLALNKWFCFSNSNLIY